MKVKNMLLLLAGCVGLVLMLALDKLYWPRAILEEGWPDFSPAYLVRGAVILASVLAVFSGLIDGRKPGVELKGKTLGMPSAAGALSASALVLLMFGFKPSVFSALSLEDGFIEQGSVLFLFGGCILAGLSLLRRRDATKMVRLSYAFLALAFFVMAMEEVSWFQRVLEIETPEVFGGNSQKETNLHNFATNHIETAYYFGAFLFLVALPLARALFPKILGTGYFGIFTPRPFIAVAGSVACAYNFDMWNIVFTQTTFFGSIAVLFAFAMFSKDRSTKGLVFSALLLLSATQVLFLVNGERFSRLWEVTEYKEMFIALGLFIYSLDLFFQAGKRRS